MRLRKRIGGVSLGEGDLSGTAKLHVDQFVLVDFPGIRTKVKTKAFGITVSKTKGHLVGPFVARSGPIDGTIVVDP